MRTGRAGRQHRGRREQRMRLRRTSRRALRRPTRPPRTSSAGSCPCARTGGRPRFSTSVRGRGSPPGPRSRRGRRSPRSRSSRPSPPWPRPAGSLHGVGAGGCERDLGRGRAGRCRPAGGSRRRLLRPRGAGRRPAGPTRPRRLAEHDRHARDHRAGDDRRLPERGRCPRHRDGGRRLDARSLPTRPAVPAAGRRLVPLLRPPSAHQVAPAREGRRARLRGREVLVRRPVPSAAREGRRARDPTTRPAKGARRRRALHTVGARATHSLTARR